MQKTSIRLPEEYLGLMDAWAAHLARGRIKRTYRTDVMAIALKRMKPPDGPGETEMALRAAYRDAFGDSE